MRALDHSSRIPIEEKARIFDIACKEYLDASDETKYETYVNRGCSSPQEAMGYRVYKELLRVGAIELLKQEQMTI